MNFGYIICSFWKWNDWYVHTNHSVRDWRQIRFQSWLWLFEFKRFFHYVDNQLIGVPPVNLHRIRRLSNISLRNNQLRCLPFSFTCLQSPGTLDLSDNPWVTPSPPLIVAKFEPKSLFHYATVAFLQVYAKLWVEDDLYSC